MLKRIPNPFKRKIPATPFEAKLQNFYGTDDLRLLGRLQWNEISQCRHGKLPEPFIKKYYSHLNFKYLVIYQKLSKELLLKFKDRIPWEYASQYQDIPEDVIEMFSDKVSWRHISQYQQLSENFIEKHFNRLDFRLISGHQRLSEEFMDRFPNILYWEQLFRTQVMSPELMKKHFFRVSKNMTYDIFKNIVLNLSRKPSVKDIMFFKSLFINYGKDTEYKKALKEVFYNKTEWKDYIKELLAGGKNKILLKNELIDTITFATDILKCDSEKITKAFTSAMQKEDNDKSKEINL